MLSKLTQLQASIYLISVLFFLQYLLSLQSESMFTTIIEHDGDEPCPPSSSGTSWVKEETVKVTTTVQWDELVLELNSWMKLLDVCIAAWEKSDSTEKRLRELEEEHANWGPPAENQDICAQFQRLQVSLKRCLHILQ